MKMSSASRRDLLHSVGAAGIGFGFGTRWMNSFYGDEPIVGPDGKRLVVRQAEPFNAEGALDNLLANWITPLESFNDLEPAAPLVSVFGPFANGFV